jgi:hypothetical protein
MRPLLVLASLLCAACTAITAPSGVASILFRLQAATCGGSGTVDFFIDGTRVGSRVMTVQDSAVFTVAAGEHTAGAVTLINGAAVVWFPPRAVVLGAGQRYTQTLGC